VQILVSLISGHLLGESQLSSEFNQRVAVAGQGSTPASEHLAVQREELRDERGLGSEPMREPCSVLVDDLGPVTISTDDERVAPRPATADVHVVAGPLAMHDAQRT